MLSLQTIHIIIETDMNQMVTNIIIIGPSTLGIILEGLHIMGHLGGGGHPLGGALAVHLQVLMPQGRGE